MAERRLFPRKKSEVAALIWAPKDKDKKNSRLDGGFSVGISLKKTAGKIVMHALFINDKKTKPNSLEPTFYTKKQ